MVAAGPAVPVAVNVTALPVRPFDVAVSVFGPAVALRVQEVSAAIPSVPVLTGVAGVTVPLPAAGVNVTATCATGLLLASFTRSEEHTSELQSRVDLVCRLLLEKKKKKKKHNDQENTN